MTAKHNPRARAIAAALLILIGACSADITKSSAPVELIVTTTSQPIQRFDLAGGTACTTATAIVLLSIRSRVKNPTTTNLTFLDVRLTHYNVSYTRTDGGTQVPAPYDRALDVIVAPGSTSSTVVFHITDFQQIFNQAPFVALLPQNGGRDPQTGSNVVKMNITLTIFGQTLAGDNVSARTTFPLDVCYNCGGCQP